MNKGIIRNSKSAYTSLTFIVRNHDEEKEGKGRMIINYKKLNGNIVFDDYYTSKKTVRFNRIQRSLFVLEDGLQKQILANKMDEESISLTA